MPQFRRETRFQCQVPLRIVAAALELLVPTACADAHTYSTRISAYSCTSAEPFAIAHPPARPKELTISWRERSSVADDDDVTPVWYLSSALLHTGAHLDRYAPCI